MLKNEVLGVKCELSGKGEFEDETSVIIGGKEVSVKTKLINFFEPREKFAVSDKAPCYIRSLDLIDLSGPTLSGEFLIKLNLRGRMHEFFVPEKEVVFLR